MEQFDIWKLLAGVGIFLFGMYLLEDAIRQLSGRAFKRFIRRSTDNPLKAIGAGALGTAILQSSSALSLMLLAFVGAGVMGMQSAIGVILGSNLGSTFTAWIIATIGFKVKIEALALPLVAIGSLSMVFLAGMPKWREAGKALTGFGFLFMGLDYLKTSIDFLAGSIDLQLLPDWGIFSYLLLGFLITAIIQLSSAAMAIALSGLFAGIITFEQAAALVIGINLGTTLTVLLGSINASPVKKRVALSHFLFNFITGFLAILILPALIWLVEQLMPVQKEPVLSLALFHTIFNLLGVLLFLPLIGLLALVVEKLFPDKHTSIALYINRLASIDPEAGLDALEREVHHLAFEAIHYNLRVLGIPPKPILAAYFDSVSQLKPVRRQSNDALLYQNLKLLQAEVISFAATLQQKELHGQEAARLNSFLEATRTAVQAAKILKDVKHELDRLQTEDNPVLNTHYDTLRSKQETIYRDLALVLDSTDQERIMAELIRLSRQIELEDSQFLSYLTSLVHQHAIDPDFISTLVSANRGFIFTIQQLIRSIIALRLPVESAKVFEHLADSEEPRKDV